MESSEKELRDRIEKILNNWEMMKRHHASNSKNYYDDPQTSQSNDYYKGSSDAFETCISDLKEIVCGGW